YGERVEGGRGKHLAGADVELGRVAGTDHDAALEVAVGERALLVRAAVVEGEPVAVDAREAHRRPADDGATQGPVACIVGRAGSFPGGLEQLGARLLHPPPRASVTARLRPTGSAGTRSTRR